MRIVAREKQKLEESNQRRRAKKRRSGFLAAWKCGCDGLEGEGGPKISLLSKGRPVLSAQCGCHGNEWQLAGCHPTLGQKAVAAHAPQDPPPQPFLARFHFMTRRRHLQVHFPLNQPHQGGSIQNVVPPRPVHPGTYPLSVPGPLAPGRPVLQKDHGGVQFRFLIAALRCPAHDPVVDDKHEPASMDRLN